SLIIRHGRAVSQGKQGLFWGGAATSRWDVAQRPVSAAASVGDGRSPLGCITRGGSRDAGTALAVTERARRWLAAQLPGNHFLGAPPFGKSGAFLGCRLGRS